MTPVRPYGAALLSFDTARLTRYRGRREEGGKEEGAAPGQSPPRLDDTLGRRDRKKWTGGYRKKGNVLYNVGGKRRRVKRHAREDVRRIK